MTTTVRAATLADVDELAVVHVRCWRQAYSHILSSAVLAQLTPGSKAEVWRSTLDHDAGVHVLAEVDGRIVGFASRGESQDDDLPDTQQLFFIYLLSEHHGTGLGQVLLDAVEPVSFCWVAADNPRAQAFYRRNGFAADGFAKREDFFGEPIDEIRVRRP